jgi:penicillin-binding protein 1A
MIFGTIGLVTLGNMLQNKPTLNVDDFFSPESSHIYDKDGNQIADVGTQLRENITYDQLPESLVDAFVSVEDSRYFRAQRL